MTLIFEYNLPTSLTKAQWAGRWHDLGALAFGSQFNDGLSQIASDFTHDSDLSQLRSNEVFLTNIWVLREFHLDLTAHALLTSTTAQTPDISLNNSQQLIDWVNANQAAILNNTHVVPQQFLGGRAPMAFPGGPTFNFSGTQWLMGNDGTPLVDANVRRAFGNQTCNGCHQSDVPDGRQNIDTFYQISPTHPVDSGDGTDRLASFIVQSELPRRATLLSNQIDCSGPDRTEGGTVSATGTSCNSTTEGPTKAYDNLMTSQSFSKWCVFSAPSASVPVSTMYDFAGTTAFAITSYTITTGNDVPGRDPKDWTFQGCRGTCTVGSDGGWVTLDTQTNQFAGAARFQTNTYSFSNNIAFQQYRLRVTANNGDGSVFQIAELQMFGGAGTCTPESDSAFCVRGGNNCGSVTADDNCGLSRTVSSCGTCASPQTCGGGGTANVCGDNSNPDRTEGGAVTATGTSCNSSTEGPTKAYDNFMTSQSFTKWCVTSAPSTSVPISTMYDFAGTTAFAITSYTITTGNDVPARDPKDWTFQGCQGTCTVGSDAGWVTLDTQTNQFAGAARLQTNTFSFANSTAFQQYRLRVTANNGDGSRFQIAELQAFGSAAGPACSPTVTSTSLAKCDSTAVFEGKLYKCISQASGVNGEMAGCGTTGVFCSNIAPTDPVWGSTAWQVLQDCP
jgi:hypothetical protein